MTKPAYASRRQWAAIGFKPVKNAPSVVEGRRRLFAAWFVEPIGTGRRGRP